MTRSSSSTPIHPQAQPFFLSAGKIGVLLIHGYGGSIGDYHRFGELLHQAGLTVSGLRIAGHGQDLETLRRTSIADMQASVSTAVQELRQQVDQCVLLGSSFGAVLALDYAAHHPQDCAGVILVNAALTYRGGGPFQAVLLRLMRCFTPYYKKRGLTSRDQQQGASVGSATAWPIDGILATKRFAQRVVVPQLGQVVSPVLIMHSQSDPVVGTAQNTLLRTRLGSSVRELYTLHSMSHRPFRDEQATREIADVTCRFIQHQVARLE